MPSEAVKVLEAAVTTILQDPDTVAKFKPIGFELRDFSTTASTANDYALNASSPEGERLIWSGTVRLDPVSSHGVFEIADLHARTLWNYARASVPLHAGILSA